jgi:methionyl-tRNA formyltransferase
MRVVFMGTPVFSTALLQKIVDKGYEVVGCYTRPPQPSGRGMALRKSPVHKLAEKLAVPVFTPKNFKDPREIETFKSLKSDVGVVAAYGLILPSAILEAPRLGCLNLHASLLPRWRGAAPIHRAIMAGDLETGVMAMKMEEGLDTGPVAAQARVAISPDMTTGELHDELSLLGAELMGETLDSLSRGEVTFTPQGDEGVTYAQKIDKSEARIDWSRPAREVHNLIRGLSPFPGSFFEADFGRGVERVKVLRARVEDGAGPPGAALDDKGLIACGVGAVRLLRVQRAGKAEMSAEEFLRGCKLAQGDALAV